VPLFGVLLADWLLAGRRYVRADIFAAPGLRLEMVVAWLAGFALYQWLYPVGPHWWTARFADLHPHALPWGARPLPSFAAAFVLAVCARTVMRAGRYSRMRDRSRRQSLRDVFPDRPPATGGAVPRRRACSGWAFLRASSPAAHAADTAELLPPSSAWNTGARHRGATTSSCAIDNDGDTRQIGLERRDTWEPATCPRCQRRCAGSTRTARALRLPRSHAGSAARRYASRYDAQWARSDPEVATPPRR